MTLRCDLCAQPAVAVAPGTDEERVRDLFRVARGEPRRAWCFACWCRAFGLGEAAA